MVMMRSKILVDELFFFKVFLNFCFLNRFDFVLMEYMVYMWCFVRIELVI